MAGDNPEKRAFKGGEKHRPNEAQTQQAAQDRENLQASRKGYDQVHQDRAKGNPKTGPSKSTADPHLPRYEGVPKSEKEMNRPAAEKSPNAASSPKFDRNHVQRDFGNDGTPAQGGKEYRVAKEGEPPGGRQGCYGSRAHQPKPQGDAQDPKADAQRSAPRDGSAAAKPDSHQNPPKNRDSRPSP